MKSVLYYKEIIDNNYSFDNELQRWIRNTFPTVNILDVDSKTEAYIFDGVFKVLKEFQHLLIILDCPFQSQVANLLPLMEEVWKDPEKFYILFNGENHSVIRMIKLCKNYRMNLDDLSQKELITSILNN